MPQPSDKTPNLDQLFLPHLPGMLLEKEKIGQMCSAKKLLSSASSESSTVSGNLPTFLCSPPSHSLAQLIPLFRLTLHSCFQSMNVHCTFIIYQVSCFRLHRRNRGPQSQSTSTYLFHCSKLTFYAFQNSP